GRLHRARHRGGSGGRPAIGREGGDRIVPRRHDDRDVRVLPPDPDGQDHLLRPVEGTDLVREVRAEGELVLDLIHHRARRSTTPSARPTSTSVTSSGANSPWATTPGHRSSLADSASGSSTGPVES